MILSSPKISHQPSMDYTKELIPSLKQMCKERKIKGYSKKTKTELITLLCEYDKMEVKTEDDPRVENTRLTEEIKCLRTVNLFLDIISSDVIEIILENLTLNEPLSFDDIQVGDKVEFIYKGEIWVGQVSQKFRTKIEVKARQYHSPHKFTVNFKCDPSTLKMTNKDIADSSNK